MDYLNYLLARDAADLSRFVDDADAKPVSASECTAGSCVSARQTAADAGGGLSWDRTLLRAAITHRSVLIATAASITNAVSQHALRVERLSDMRAFCPAETSTLSAEPLLTASALALPPAISHAMQSFDQRCAFAVRMSCLTLDRMATATAQTEIESDALATLVDCWRKTACAAITLIELLHVPSHTETEADATAEKLDADPGADTHALLTAIAAGGHPCVADGIIAIPGWAERRTLERQLSDRTVTVTRGAVSWAARLRDISATGAGLASTELVVVGDTLMIAFTDTCIVQCRVQWNRGARYGVRFTTHLSDSDVVFQTAAAE